jgi:hypothetical protein
MFCAICAESLYLEVGGKGVAQKEVSLLPEALRTSADMTVLAEPIRRLLSNQKYQVTTKKECAKHETCIEPVIDDRMFVACYYQNGAFVDAMREWEDDQYCYLTHAKEKYPFDKLSVASRLYTMMYVDGDGICCHSRDMLQKMLSDEHIYTRRLEYGWYDEKTEETVFAGIITGISEYALISVAKNPPPHLIDAFLTQYVEMAILTLAQRASLLSFEYMISEYARGEKNYSAPKIHDKYILFQSQLLLNEVTPQQQGIELYELLKANLMIDKQKAEIKEQIEGSFEHVNYIHDKKENRMLLLISLLSIVEMARTLVDLFGADESNLYWKLGAGVLIAMILLGIYRKK